MLQLPNASPGGASPSVSEGGAAAAGPRLRSRRWSEQFWRPARDLSAKDDVPVSLNWLIVHFKDVGKKWRWFGAGPAPVRGKRRRRSGAAPAHLPCAALSRRRTSAGPTLARYERIPCLRGGPPEMRGYSL